MDIENQFKRRKFYKTSSNIFDLEACRWRVMGQNSKKKKEIGSPNSKGFIHSAVTLKNSIFTFIGPDDNKSQASLHSFNFKTSEWKIWTDCNMPIARDSFGLTVHKNEIYLFGGSSYDRQFNDLHFFNTMNGFWNTLQSGLVSPRNPLIFTDVGNEYILLYGGLNVETGSIYNDAFLLIDNKWIEIHQIVNSPNNLVEAKTAVCGSRIFLFGGQIQVDGQMKENHVMYELRVDLSTLKLQFLDVNVIGGIKPCNRAAHSMLGINKDYFIMVGGVGLSVQSGSRLLRDIWLFDVEQFNWTKIDPVNGAMRPFCDNSIVLNNNIVMIFGGTTQQLNMWNQQIIGVQFGQHELFKNQICTNCIQKATQNEKQQKSFPKTVVLSSGFFYTIALQIKHPFQAISILYDCATYLKATTFRISVDKSLNQNEHIQIEFDGNSINKQQFQQLVCHSSTGDQEYARFITNIKVAALRLGKTFVYVTADQYQRKVFMFSADSKVAPAFDQSYGYFAYVENIKKNQIQSHQGKAHRSLIINMLRSRLAEPEQILNIRNGNKILIFQKNILVTSDKVYYYELISSDKEDISIYKNLKKIQFLDGLGYQISKQPEISLKSYVSNMRLNFQTSPAFFINKSQQPVSSFQYLQKLKNMYGKNILSVEMPTKIHDIELEVALYAAESPLVIDNNLGILIYFQGNLVNRMDVNFGDLFKQEFYKMKFKKAYTLFQFMGVINVKKGLSLNYFSNWFKKNRNYYLFIEGVREAMRKAKLDKLERQLKSGIEDPQDRKLMKKIKT